MDEKRGRGRPEGREYPYSRTIRLKQIHVAAAEALAARWGCTVAEAIRRATLDASRREKVG